MPRPAWGQVADEAPTAHLNGTTRRPEPDASQPGSPTSAKPGSVRSAGGIAAPSRSCSASEVLLRKSPSPAPDQKTCPAPSALSPPR